MHGIRSKLTYSNVVATLCLIVVMGGGTAYAASQLEKESVGTKQLKKEAVTPTKLSKAAKAALTGPEGPKGATGSAGPQGPKGETGQAGAAGSARAWAKVSSSGEIEQGVGFASVEQFSTGVYCAHLESSFVRGKYTALATVHGGSGDRLSISDYPGGCGSGPTIQVNIWEGSTTLTNAGFSLLVP